MGDDHALGIGRGTGSEDDFSQIVARNVLRGDCARVCPIDIGEPPRAGFGILGPHDLVADPDDFSVHAIADAQEKCGRSAEIHGDRDGSGQQTGPEGCNPFRPVFAPEYDFVAFADTRFVEPHG